MSRYNPNRVTPPINVCQFCDVDSSLYTCIGCRKAVCSHCCTGIPWTQTFGANVICNQCSVKSRLHKK